MSLDRDKCFVLLALSTFDGKVVATHLGNRTFPDMESLSREIRTGCGHVISVHHLDDIIDRMVSNYGTASVVLEVLGGESRLADLLEHYHIPIVSNRTLPLRATVGPGEAAEDRYSPISEQGSGGMGRVLVVHDTRIGREIALKELLPQSKAGVGSSIETPVRATTAAAARFLQEGYVTARLEHPSIVPVYEVGQREDGSLYYTMRLVRGRSMREALAEAATLGERLAYLHNFREVCQAVSYAHSRGVLHRDLKPANIMIGDFGETVLIDWGLAKVKDVEDMQGGEMAALLISARQDEKFQPPDTLLGEAIGTPHYMSPEQAAGKIDEVDERSDVFSLGVILYQLLSGAKPFQGSNLESILQKVIVCEPPPLSFWGYNGPPELAAICAKAMRREKEDRYQSAAELLADITNFQTGALVSSYSYRSMDLLRRFYRRHRIAVSTAAAAAAVVLLVVAVSFVNIMQARGQEQQARMRAESAAQAAQDAADHANLQYVQAAMQSGSRHEANAALDKISEESREWEWGHFAHQLREATQTIAMPSEALYLYGAFDFPPGQFITVQADGTASWWGDGAAPVRQEAGRKVRATDAALSPVGLAVGFENGDVFIHSLDNPGEHKRIHVRGAVAALGWSATHKLVVGTRSGKVSQYLSDGRELWSRDVAPGLGGLTTDTMAATVVVHDGAGQWWSLDAINGAVAGPFQGGPGAIDSQGKYYLTLKGSVPALYEAPTGTLLWEQAGQSSHCRPAFSRTGGVCATADTAGVVTIRQVDGTLVSSFSTLPDPIELVFLEEDALLVAGSRNGIAMFTVRDGHCFQRIEGAANQCIDVALDEHRPQLAAVAADGSVQIFNMAGAGAYRAVAMTAAPVVGMANGVALTALGTRDGAVEFFGPNAPGDLQGVNEDGVRYLAWLDEDTLLCNIDACTPALLQPKSGTLKLLTPSRARIRALAAAEGIAYAGMTDRSISRWDSAFPDAPISAGLPATATAILPRSEGLLVGLQSGELLALDAQLNIAKQMSTLPGAITALAHTDTGAIAGTSEGTFALLDDRGVVTASKRFKEKVQAIAVMSSKRAAVIFDYGQLRIIELPSLEVAAELDSTGAQNALAWEPESAAIFTAGEGGMLQRLTALPWRTRQSLPPAEPILPGSEKPALVVLPTEVVQATIAGFSASSQDSPLPIPPNPRLRLEEAGRLLSLNDAATATAESLEAARQAALDKIKTGAPIQLVVETGAPQQQAITMLHAPRLQLEQSVSVSKGELLSLLDLWLSALRAPGSFQRERTAQWLARRGSAGERMGLLVPPVKMDEEVALYRQFGVVAEDMLYLIDETELSDIDSLVPRLEALRAKVSGGLATLTLHVARGDFQEMEIAVNITGSTT